MSGKLIVLFAALAVVAAALVIQGIRCRAAVRKGRERLAAYRVHTAALGYGNVTYVDEGAGDVILSVHGIFGGYDQAFETCRDFVPDFRILAPSRFGYLGSDVSGAGTPADQAAAYAELLDSLGIDRAYLLATSAGGSVALRFALDFPERTKGLILYCSAMPLAEKPERYAEYAGPPAFLCSDFAMFLLSPLFGPLMGMSPSTVTDMLPVGERRKGVLLDASVTNPDMARNYDAYPVERLPMPVLILHARDDRLASYDAVTKALPRFPDRTDFVSFETGGHLMVGHEETVRRKVREFVRRNPR